ncbi:MAG TPA: type II toxin-antitoxin system PemK/MazF family toxin [Thermoanaerobaculia bacterium]|nr:type II toxin-antitoxin system PemK/MazF family toxin [Thermoanaerobaculia bacterium]
MVISQGEIWWADLGEPAGSGPGYRRPVVVVQCDVLNQSRVGTVVCVPLTSNLKWEGAPGNVLLATRATGLSRDSVANVSLIVAIDKQQLTECVGRLPLRELELVLAGIDVVLGR